MPKQPTLLNIRQRIAIQAAQLIARHHISFARARDKAAKRLNCTDPHQLPENREIEAALRDHQQLFQATRQPEQLKSLRKAALNAMRSLKSFNPLLIGQVLSGTAFQHTPIEIILFADTNEEVILELMAQRIPWRQREIRADYTQKKHVKRSILSFIAGEDEIHLLILPIADRHNLPLDPIERRPHKGASINKVLKMLDPD
jgi:hypothetical protein